MTCFRIESTGENLNQYCKRTGKNYQTLWFRMDKGWDLERAITEPILGVNGTKYYINGKPARSQMTKNEYQRYTKKLRKESK